MASRCAACGREEYMPFVCKLCRGRFCVEHRLPENHECGGLPAYRDRTRSEGRLYADPHAEPLRPTVGRSARARAGVDRLFERVEGRVTFVLLGLIVATFVAQFLTGFGSPLMRAVFVMSTDFLVRPWSVVTSLFAHGGFNHLFGNALVLFFFGTALEGLIGSRRFTGLFFVAGVLAGLAEIVVGAARGSVVSVLGASGAIMGVLGALTVLAPRLTVLVFFVIPAPLWLITALYALFDIAYLGADDRVAHLAHLAGLAVGLLYGKRLHDQGLRARVQPQPGIQFRRYL